MSTAKPATEREAELVSKESVNKILYDGYQRHLHECTNSVRAAEFMHGLQKAVAALPPTDFEQPLRGAATEMLEALRTADYRYGIYSIAPNLKAEVDALRNALETTERGVK